MKLNARNSRFMRLQSSIPGMKESLIEAKNAPDDDFVDADEVEW